MPEWPLLTIFKIHYNINLLDRAIRFAVQIEADVGRGKVVQQMFYNSESIE